MFPCVLRTCSVFPYMAWPSPPHTSAETRLTTQGRTVPHHSCHCHCWHCNRYCHHCCEFKATVCFWVKWLQLHLKNQFSYQLTGLIANSETVSHLISRLIHRFCNSSTFRKVDRHVSHIYRVTMTTHSYNGPFWKKKFTLTKNLQSVSQEKYDAKKEQGKRTCE